jgi:signal transduction histidine kinase
MVKYFDFKEEFKNNALLLFALSFIFTFSFLLCAAITFFNYFAEYGVILLVAYTMSIFVFAIVFLDGNIQEKLLISVLVTVILAGVAFIIPLSISLLAEEYLAVIINMGFDIFRLIILMLLFAIYVIILNFILYLKREFYEIQKFQWLIFILAPVISLFSVITYTSYYVFLVVAVISIIILNILIYVFMGILNRNNKIITQYKLESQQRLYEEKNIDNIKSMYDKIKELKHDMKQHNDGIISRITDIPEINAFQNRYIGDIIEYIRGSDENIDIIKSIIYTGNKSIDSLLNYKISVASEKNIKIEIVIDKNISDISDVDLCRILGNLLDNAIEACEKENTENKTIILHMTTKNSCLLICVKNSISESVISTNPDFTTTKQDKEIHGIGLKSIKSIVERYSGCLKISEEDKFFILYVVLVAQM